MYKFFVYCPRDERVIRAIIDAASGAGAGMIGNYSHCAFVSEGRGTWIPLPGANPSIGTVGEFSSEEEARIEMECPKEKMPAVLAAIKSVHPYDKVAIDAVEFARFE